MIVLSFFGLLFFLNIFHDGLVFYNLQAMLPLPETTTAPDLENS